MNDDLKGKKVCKSHSVMSPFHDLNLSNSTLGVMYCIKLREVDKYQAIIDTLENDCAGLFSELLERKNDDLDAVVAFLKECEKFVS